MVKTVDLKLGQRFQAEDGLLWELEKFVDVMTAIPHVRLVDPKDRSVNKIIAKSVLLDQTRFSSIDRTSRQDA